MYKFIFQLFQKYSPNSLYLGLINYNQKLILEMVNELMVYIISNVEMITPVKEEYLALEQIKNKLEK